MAQTPRGSLRWVAIFTSDIGVTCAFYSENTADLAFVDDDYKVTSCLANRSCPEVLFLCRQQVERGVDALLPCNKFLHVYPKRRVTLPVESVAHRRA